MRRYRALLLAAIGLAGCYTYTPVESPTPGMEVRARLTAEAASRHSQGLDEPVLSYAGRVVSTSADALALDVLVARSSSAFQNVTIRDTVTLRRTEIQSVLHRKFSAPRSALFTVGAVAAGVLVVAGIEQIVGGTGPEEQDPGTPALREPFFVRIPFHQLIGWLTARQ